MNNKIKILFLCVNPYPETKLRLDHEMKSIKNALLASPERDKFEIFSEWAVTPSMLIQSVLRIEPTIIHFSGHGNEQGIILENEMGQPHIATTQGLNALFKELSDIVKFIIFNSCYSHEQATVISQHIDYVVGMKKAVPDTTAIKFATGLYLSLGSGKDYLFSYKMGIVNIKLENVVGDDIPEFWSRGRIFRADEDNFRRINERDLSIIEEYLKDKNLDTISFEKAQEDINPKFDEKYLMKLVELYPHHLRRCRIHEGKFGIKIIYQVGEMAKSIEIKDFPSDYHRDLYIIEQYLEAKQWGSISFVKAQENINPKFDEKYLTSLTEAFPEKIRRCRIGQGKHGIKIVKS